MYITPTNPTLTKLDTTKKYNKRKEMERVTKKDTYERSLLLIDDAGRLAYLESAVYLFSAAYRLRGEKDRQAQIKALRTKIAKARTNNNKGK